MGTHPYPLGTKTQTLLSLQTTRVPDQQGDHSIRTYQLAPALGVQTLMGEEGNCMPAATLLAPTIKRVVTAG